MASLRWVRGKASVAVHQLSVLGGVGAHSWLRSKRTEVAKLIFGCCSEGANGFLRLVLGRPSVFSLLVEKLSANRSIGI